MHFSCFFITLTLVAAAPLPQPGAGFAFPKTNVRSTSPISGSSVVTKAPTLSKTINDSAATGSCTALESFPSSRQSQKGKRLMNDDGVQHPPGQSNVVLFHGTWRAADAAKLASEVKLSVIKNGDLHSTAVSGVDGGFYLTDSLLSAAQFACRNVEPKAYVLEYQWFGANLHVQDYQPGAEFSAFLDYRKVAENHARNPAFDQIMKDNDMITGPMNDEHADAFLSPNFRQYAVIKQQAATNNLNAVPIGANLLPAYYTASQRANHNFPTLLHHLTQCPFNIGGWGAVATLGGSEIEASLN
ncbi:hypothetical protein J3R30DRAFT_3809345 [Lentinula aciculospora]|uniref:PARP catalytic domain-containing protein n=1 Tax=Lentinula aciculospora TaxID=153920 RepID=A0A9W8ZYH4_9AGAR|nr:hypothetical protein J3R30DRAFT_3809345 [Lentinula aciculospora]